MLSLNYNIVCFAFLVQLVVIIISCLYVTYFSDFVNREPAFDPTNAREMSFNYRQPKEEDEEQQCAVDFMREYQVFCQKSMFGLVCDPFNTHSSS